MVARTSNNNALAIDDRHDPVCCYTFAQEEIANGSGAEGHVPCITYFLAPGYGYVDEHERGFRHRADIDVRDDRFCLLVYRFVSSNENRVLADRKRRSPFHVGVDHLLVVAIAHRNCLAAGAQDVLGLEVERTEVASVDVRMSCKGLQRGRHTLEFLVEAGAESRRHRHRRLFETLLLVTPIPVADRSGEDHLGNEDGDGEGKEMDPDR